MQKEQRSQSTPEDLFCLLLAQADSEGKRMSVLRKEGIDHIQFLCNQLLTKTTHIKFKLFLRSFPGFPKYQCTPALSPTNMNELK